MTDEQRKQWEEAAEKYAIDNGFTRAPKTTDCYEHFLAGCEHAAPKWVDCNERLPKVCVNVLVWHKDRKTTLTATRYPEGYKSKKYHWRYYDVDGSNDLNPDEVTHWQPLPLNPRIK